MEFSVGGVYEGRDFKVNGASYAGNPRDHTVMYITGKVGYLINNLYGHKNCLCFVQDGVEVPEGLEKDNAFVFSNNPAYEYAVFAEKMEKEVQKQERAAGYRLTDGGYYVGEQVSIGENAVIEPGVVIGHGVVIGDNARILAGSVIKRATVGSGFLCNENAVVGNQGFALTQDSYGNKLRIPTLGRVMIGDNVEAGACCDISAGACGDTVLEDYVKLDSLVHIGHEAHLHKNVVVTACVAVAGFVEVFDHGYIGVNASIKNRIALGKGSLIGMGAVVTKPVEEGLVVVGNPARKLETGGVPVT